MSHRTADIRTFDIRTLVSFALLTLSHCWHSPCWLRTGVVRTFVFRTLVVQAGDMTRLVFTDIFSLAFASATARYLPADVGEPFGQDLDGVFFTL